MVTCFFEISLKLLIFFCELAFKRLAQFAELGFVVLSQAKLRSLQLLDFFKELCLGMLEVILEHLCFVQLVLGLVLSKTTLMLCVA